jgi:RNA polymerase sigma-70 factor, ECF subfamily
MPRPIAQEDDAGLVAALCRGDEDEFAALVDRHSPAMIRVAMAYVPSRAAAEEVVQETWIAVMRGIDGFEGRSSLRTWIFRILTNVAMRAGARERRSMPFSALAAADDTGEPSVDPDRFLPADHDLFPGHWAIMPARCAGRRGAAVRGQSGPIDRSSGPPVMRVAMAADTTAKGA